MSRKHQWMVYGCSDPEFPRLGRWVWLRCLRCYVSTTASATEDEWLQAKQRSEDYEWKGAEPRVPRIKRGVKAWYPVAAGDTRSTITEKFYGTTDPAMWEVVFDSNMKIFDYDDEAKLIPGMLIHIPDVNVSMPPCLPVWIKERSTVRVPSTEATATKPASDMEIQGLVQTVLQAIPERHHWIFVPVPLPLEDYEKYFFSNRVPLGAWQVGAELERGLLTVRLVTNHRLLVGEGCEGLCCPRTCLNYYLLPSVAAALVSLKTRLSRHLRVLFKCESEHGLMTLSCSANDLIQDDTSEEAKFLEDFEIHEELWKKEPWE